MDSRHQVLPEEQKKITISEHDLLQDIESLHISHAPRHSLSIPKTNSLNDVITKPTTTVPNESQGLPSANNQLGSDAVILRCLSDSEVLMQPQVFAMTVKTQHVEMGHLFQVKPTDNIKNIPIEDISRYLTAVIEDNVYYPAINKTKNHKYQTSKTNIEISLKHAFAIVKISDTKMQLRISEYMCLNENAHNLLFLDELQVKNKLNGELKKLESVLNFYNKENLATYPALLAKELQQNIIKYIIKNDAEEDFFADISSYPVVAQGVIAFLGGEIHRCEEYYFTQGASDEERLRLYQTFPFFKEALEQNPGLIKKSVQESDSYNKNKSEYLPFNAELPTQSYYCITSPIKINKNDYDALKCMQISLDKSNSVSFPNKRTYLSSLYNKNSNNNVGALVELYADENHNIYYGYDGKGPRLVANNGVNIIDPSTKISSSLAFTVIKYFDYQLKLCVSSANSHFLSAIDPSHVRDIVARFMQENKFDLTNLPKSLAGAIMDAISRYLASTHLIETSSTPYPVVASGEFDPLLLKDKSGAFYQYDDTSSDGKRSAESTQSYFQAIKCIPYFANNYFDQQGKPNDKVRSYRDSAEYKATQSKIIEHIPVTNPPPAVAKSEQVSTTINIMEIKLDQPGSTHSPDALRLSLPEQSVASEPAKSAKGWLKYATASTYETTAPIFNTHQQAPNQPAVTPQISKKPEPRF